MYLLIFFFFLKQNYKIYKRKKRGKKECKSTQVSTAGFVCWELTFILLTSMLGIHSLDRMRGRKGGISAILGGEAFTRPRFWGLWLTGECMVECACLRKGGISGIWIGCEETRGLIVSLKWDARRNG